MNDSSLLIFCFSIFAVVEPSAAFRPTAKSIHHRKSIVDYPSWFDSFNVNTELKLSFSDKNSSEPPEYSASKSANIGSNPLNMPDQALDAAITRAVDPVKQMTIVQALNAHFISTGE